MKTWLILQLMLFVMLLAVPSEEFFFDPKKAFMEFLQSLRTKRQPSNSNIHHYHMYYYPAPFPMFAWKAPEKQDLYDDTLRSFGWLNYPYRYLPEPSIIMSSGLLKLWEDTDLWDQEILGSDNVESIDRNSKGLLVQVPVNQRIVFHMLQRLQRQAN